MARNLARNLAFVNLGQIWGHPFAGFVVADVGKLRSQLFEGHSRQCSDLVCHVECHVFAPFYWRLGTLNRADH